MKVHVTSELGGGAQRGLIDPQLGMVTHQGTITQIDTDGGQVGVSGGGVGALTRFYPNQLMVTYTHATGVWAWPTGGLGAVAHGHVSDWPAGTRTEYHPVAAHWVIAALLETLNPGRTYPELVHERVAWLDDDNAVDLARPRRALGLAHAPGVA